MTRYFPTLLSITTWQSIVNIAVCSLFASALFVALCWPRVRSVRLREQPSSVCLPGRADTVAAAQTADSCISLASSICYLETSDFITADQCSCTPWLSPRLSALSVCLSFSWAVSNWILAGMLIAHSAAFAISSSTSPSPSVLTSVFNLPSSLGFMSSPDSWPSVWSSLYDPSLNIIPVFTDSSAVACMWL